MRWGVGRRTLSSVMVPPTASDTKKIPDVADAATSQEVNLSLLLQWSI